MLLLLLLVLAQTTASAVSEPLRPKEEEGSADTGVETAETGTAGKAEMLIRLAVLIVLNLLPRLGIIIGSSVVCVVPIAVAGTVLVFVVVVAVVEAGGLVGEERGRSGRLGRAGVAGVSSGTSSSASTASRFDRTCDWSDDSCAPTQSRDFACRKASKSIVRADVGVVHSLFLVVAALIAALELAVAVSRRASEGFRMGLRGCFCVGVSPPLPVLLCVAVANLAPSAVWSAIRDMGSGGIGGTDSGKVSVTGEGEAERKNADFRYSRRTTTSCCQHPSVGLSGRIWPSDSCSVSDSVSGPGLAVARGVSMSRSMSLSSGRPENETFFFLSGRWGLSFATILCDLKCPCPCPWLWFLVCSPCAAALALLAAAAAAAAAASFSSSDEQSDVRGDEGAEPLLLVVTEATEARELPLDEKMLGEFRKVLLMESGLPFILFSFSCELELRDVLLDMLWVETADPDRDRDRILCTSAPVVLAARSRSTAARS